MAEIKLVFKPDYSEVSKAIAAIKNDISKSIGNVKITIDSSGAKAAQSLASNLQGASSAAAGLNETLKKTETYVDGVKAKETERTRTAIGEYKEINKANDKVTETYIHNEEEKRKAARKTAEDAEKRRVEEYQAAEKHRQEQVKRDQQEAKEAEKRRIEEYQAAEKHRQDQIKRDQQAAEEAVKLAAKKAEAQKKAEETAVQLERQYSNLIRQIQNLKAQYPEGTFDAIEQQAREARDELRNLDKTSEDYANRVKNSSGFFQRLLRDVANVRQETAKLDKVTESFWMNIQKFARWYIGGNIVTKVIGSLREALATMKAVDTELANIQKVTDRTDQQMQKTAEAAYKVASAYGVAAEDYLESVAEFAKAGFGDQSEQLAEIATKTQLVGDVTSTIANKFLIASNAAWKMNGDIATLNKTLDAANIIENNYATSIEKLAAGMPIVSSIAAQAGMTFEETIAALGTITAVTQETGTKAATALRALILNILGAVGEYEDGIEITEESVKSLDGILQVYAKDALAAAKAAGTVINPMEAIAALAKASEEGLVNQAELFEVLSSLGGKLRTNQLTALVQNFDMMQEMLDKTTQSAGSADKEIGVMLDTWEAKTNILKNTWTEFVSGLLDTDAIKLMLDGLIKLVELLNTDLGRGIVISAGVATAVLGIIGAIKSLTAAIAALNMTTMANPLFAAIAAGTFAIYGVVTAIGHIRNATDEWAQAAQDAKNEYEETATKIDTLLSKQGELTEAEERRLEILKAEAKLKEEDAKRTAMAAYNAAYSSATKALPSLFGISPLIVPKGNYSEGDVVGTYEPALGKGATVYWKGSNDTSLQKATDLIQTYNDIQSKRQTANTTAEMEDLEQQANDTLTAITGMANHLLGLQEILGDDLPEAGKEAIDLLIGFIKALNGTSKADESAANKTKKLVSLLNEARRLGVDINKTVYGNIDTNNRQVIQWTQANLEKYKNELASWGYEIEDLFGSISTVMGTSSEFDGIEIAFSPILQTNSGPVLLSEDTVNRYIFGLIEKAGEGWTNEDLLGLDAEGLIIDGGKIQNLLADVGDTAIQTGQAMHYVGQYGALALAGMTTHTVQVKTLKEIMAEASAAATKYDTAIGAVITAMTDFGAGSIEVYNAMVKLEAEIPGSTDKLYDFNTATWKINAGLIESKGDLLDFIDTQKQLEFSSAISELEAVATAYWDIAGAAVAAMSSQEAAAQMAGVLAFTGGDASQTHYDIAQSRLAELKAQKAEWDLYISTLRQRKDYSTPRDTKENPRDTETPEDKELARLQSIVELRKAELSFLQASGASTEEIVAKYKEIQNALHDENERRRAIRAEMEAQGATEEELAEIDAQILGTSTEWWNVQKEINEELEKTQGKSVDELERLESIVSLRKAELSFLEASGASEDELNAKRKEIQNALHEEAEYKRKIRAEMEAQGATEEELAEIDAEILALGTEWWEIQKDILETKQKLRDIDQTELNRLKGIVDQRKQELQFLEASGASEDEINAKRKEIQASLHDQAEEMRRILAIMIEQGASEEEIRAYETAILALSTEWWTYENDIEKSLERQKQLREEMFDTIKKTVDDYYAKILSDKEEELSLEERILAVQKAQADLANAQRERTVRYYNAATGQWEWQANAKNVKSAEDALKKAQDDLNKYQKEQAWKAFKSAWEYVSEQIKAGAMTFREAYDYMYAEMKKIQDTYGVDLGFVLDDSIGGFKELNYGIDGLTQEVADTLGASVGVLYEKLREYETAVGAFKKAFDDASDKVKSGEMSMEDAYSYLRDRAKEIADKYGIDMTGALEEAIAGMDKTNMSIDELWKAVIINLMKVNSARWFDANEEERAYLHAQNEYLGSLIGATYDPSGYWYLNGSQLYGSQRGVDVSGKSGYGESTGGGGAASAGTSAASASATAIRGAAGTGKFYDSYGNEYATLEEAVAGNAANSGGGTGEGGKPLYKGTGFLAADGEAGKITAGAWGVRVADASGYMHRLGETGGFIKSSDGYVYNTATATDYELATLGLFRDNHGGIRAIEDGMYLDWEGMWNDHLKEMDAMYATNTEGGNWSAMTDLANNDLSESGMDPTLLDAVSTERPIADGGTVYEGDTYYTMNGVTIGEDTAKSTTVYELARMAGMLGNYSA